jgi:hypothetical protein
MHYHLELVMPPITDIDGAIKAIMEPFDESNETNRHGFFDWYQIGGRFSGSKIESLVSQEKKDAFFAELRSRNVTVSCFQSGKQGLSPASQIPMVDALWREMCPESGIDVCPFFQHAKALPMDVCKLADVPDGLCAERVIIAAPAHDGKIEASSMFSTEIWNGCNYERTAWDGNVKKAIDERCKKIDSYNKEYKERNTPAPDWLVITLDYHT